jgi:Bleomycin resistance protein-like N-terminal
MTRYVDPTEQLVTEIVVKDIKRSVDFYRRLGFGLIRDGGDFVELAWEDNRLFLAELSAFSDAHDTVLPTPSPFPCANVRVMCPMSTNTGNSLTKLARKSSFHLLIAIMVCVISPSLIWTGLASGLRACCRSKVSGLKS